MSDKHVIGIILVLLTALAFGCDNNNDKQCTEIGCDHGIFLEFEDDKGQPLTAFGGTITVADQVLEIECGPGTTPTSADYTCDGNHVFVRAADADKILVDVRATDNHTLVYVDEVSVNFEPQYPNGKDCPAACQQATKTLKMKLYEPN